MRSQAGGVRSALQQAGNMRVRQGSCRRLKTHQTARRSP